MPERTPEEKEWTKERTKAVLERYSAYQVLHDMGHGEIVPDRGTATQISCLFHGADARPSARYYPSEGGKNDHVYCFKCKEQWNAVALHAKLNNVPFMGALMELERRFGIKASKGPKNNAIADPGIKGSQYKSGQWGDVEKLIALAEKRLKSIRHLCNLTDYIKFCRVIDNIQWDLNHGDGEPHPTMVPTLRKLLDKISEAKELARQIESL